MKSPTNCPTKRAGEPGRRLPAKGRTALVAMAVALALGALRCSLNVPLGVDPRSDAADYNNNDGGAGD